MNYVNTKTSNMIDIREIQPNSHVLNKKFQKRKFKRYLIEFLRAFIGRK